MEVEVTAGGESTKGPKIIERPSRKTNKQIHNKNKKSSGKSGVGPRCVAEESMTNPTAK